MPDSSRFALGLFLLWFACVCLFAAFHPGGLLMPGAAKNRDGSTNQDQTTTVNGASFHAAQNPTDVVKYMMLHLTNPGSNTSAQSS